MAKKIEGRVNYMMGSYAFLPGKEQPPKGNPWKCSTLVIHDGSIERMFTESEVVAILRECEYQLETLSIGKIKVGLTGVLHGRGISDPA